MGNGTATVDKKEDVYILEEQPTSTGNIESVKVATTAPVKIAATTNNSKTYNVVYYGTVENSNITLGNLFDSDNSDGNDPAKEYGYANKEGVVDASTLVEGDVINYYYDKTKAPIECVVMYNDETHGLQVISLDSVRDVILGYNDTNQDPKAVEAFADKNNDGEEDAPEGYYVL